MFTLRQLGKIIASLLLCFNFVNLFGSSGEIPNATITVPSLTNIKTDQTFDISINVSGLNKDDSVIVYAFKLDYDKSLVEFLSTNTDGSLSQNGMVVDSTSEDGFLVVGYRGLPKTFITTDGVLIKLTFKAKSQGVFTPKITNFFFNTKSVIKFVIGNTEISNYKIHGNVVDGQNQPITSGYAILLKKSTQQFEKVDSINLVEGAYSFSNLHTGTYIVIAYPAKDKYPLALPTYLGNNALWDLATALSLTPTFEDKSYDIAISFMAELKGTATIKGELEYDNNVVAIAPLKSAKSIQGKPVKRVSVVLIGKSKSTESIIARTMTDDYGYFEFKNIPDGLYTIKVDMPGLPMIEIPKVIVESGKAYAPDGKTTFESLEMVVQATGIVVTNSIFTGINQTNALTSLSIYPNPVSDILFIKTSKDLNITNIDVVNTSGVIMLHFDHYTDGIPVKSLPSGSYFLRINKTTSIPFIKTR